METVDASEQTNRILFLLTLVTVLALPINLIAGLFGMNVGGIPLAASRHGFLTVVAIVVAFTAGESLSSGGLAKAYGFTDLDGSRPDCWRYLQEVQEAGKPADAAGYR